MRVSAVTIERPKRTDELLNFKEKYLSGDGHPVAAGIVGEILQVLWTS